MPASALCNTLTISLDPDTVYTRQWRIRVTQYDGLGSAGRSGVPPPGCLQWYSGVGSGTVASFNYK